MAQALCVAISLPKGLVSCRVGSTKVRRIKVRKSSFGIVAVSLALALACLPASAADDAAADGAVGPIGAGGTTAFQENGKMNVAITWTCEARSDTGGFGIGVGMTRVIAARTAMNYCRANTPPFGTCYMTGCEYEV